MTKGALDLSDSSIHNLDASENAYMLKNMGYRLKLLLTITVILTTGTIIVIVWSGYTSFYSIRDNVSDQAFTLSDSISQALRAIMASGESHRLEGYLNNIRKAKTVKGVRIVRASVNFPSGPY